MKGYKNHQSGIYYHASLVHIKQFHINYGGLHLGGHYSALEAAARKVRDMGSSQRKAAQIYLHSVLVDNSLITQETFDHGSAEGWEQAITAWKRFGLLGAHYTNEFEPDVRKSLILCCTSPIKSISSVQALTLDQAEIILEEIEDHYSFA